MALSWNEIKSRALQFSTDWGDETQERAEKDSFWNEFFEVFGINRKRIASFEHPVKNLKGNTGFIDMLWKGMLLIEHKSAGENLDKAYNQATDYFYGLKDQDLPKYIIVCDFQKIRLYDLDDNTQTEFALKDFYKNVSLFGFIAGYQKRTFKEQDPVNIKAAELMGKLHDNLKEAGYTGHNLEVYLVRLLFVLFADDTSIFEKDIFKDFIDLKTNTDGSDLGALLAQFFQVLNTPPENRLKTLDEDLAQFPYINGNLFKEQLPIAAFNKKMRDIVLEASALDWGKISPAIFGSMFQSVMNPIERRHLGAHYTSEKNILKLIQPLFLDNLQQEFEKIKNNSKKLQEFHLKLSKLKFLDPACGSGNFLIITYRELRELEIKILQQLHKKQERVLDLSFITKIDVDQFYGIEYDEFACQIAQVAMWLIDHQMNMKLSEKFGQYFTRLPLKKSANIHHQNSLTTNWTDIIPPAELSYILGNPPFIGERQQSKTQREELENLFNKKVKLDYVTAWYKKAAVYMQNTVIKTAFVSTNSIAQGEQVGILWKELFNEHQIKIHFAHQTFNWSNEAKHNAAVHVVIIGFANFDSKNKKIFEYENINGEAHEKQAKNVNPYLVDANDFFIEKRNKPLCEIKKMQTGCRANDRGKLLFTEQEKNDFIKNEPLSNTYFKQVMGAKEFINNIPRYALWLENINPADLRQMKSVLKIIDEIRQFRDKNPHLFSNIRKPQHNYLFIPQLSSEKREYIPIGFLDKNIIPLDPHFVIDNAGLYDFGILTSKLHMVWIKYVCGKLESRFRYSNSIVYNNYPFPKKTSDKNKKAVQGKAAEILKIRAQYQDNSLADLYDPLSMPPKLKKAHIALDKAVDICYTAQTFKSDKQRIEFLFTLYQKYLDEK
ncbi:MAG: class I SAM-dependent DNA methyltransferase [Gammaproteobacteria bacterium]|nr:MAG: class I SAM-dependent DNA methyltransferase [Gammaproteobacteria bacterium]